MNPEVIRDPELARVRARELAAAGRLALVPTMGFLHEGHLSLMREGGRRADSVAVSIFVNPTQFGPAEDLSRYPRDMEGDLRKCASAGVRLVYAPEPAAVYPPGYQTFIEVEELQKGLCGDRRPGHFRGVATVVAKLFNLLRPHVALFGEKDYQQLQVIQRMNADLELGVEVVGMPIVREADNLAMSSRNAYLAPADRKRALALSRGLFAARERFVTGERRAATLRHAVLDELAKVEARVDYVELVDAATLRSVDTVNAPARLLVAAYLGTTRLIDNIAIG